MKYVSLIPLIGGFTIAAERELGKKPEFIVSYEAALKNDEQYLHNNELMKSKYFTVSEETNEIINSEEEKIFDTFNNDIDIVTCVPPCSGLSLLNACTDKNSAYARGANAHQNRFMYLSSEFALKNIKPKVFVFENAPALYTEFGKGVFDRLVEIGKKYGYSFSAYKTSTVFHGLPQKRMRTFGFFWKSDNAPIMNFYETKYPTVADYLNEIPKDATYHNINEATDRFNENPYTKFMYAVEGENFRVNNRKDDNNYSVINYLIDNNKIEEMITWMEQFGDKYILDINTLKHVIYKRSINLGFWDSSPLIITDFIGAVISKNSMRFVHPSENRFLTLRECTYLMGLPNNFQLTHEKNGNMITQNVPTNTAQDMIKEAVKFINGKLKDSGSPIVKQDNTNKRIDFPQRSKLMKNSFMKVII